MAFSVAQAVLKKGRGAGRRASFSEDVSLVEFKYLACQMRVTVGDSGVCCCVCVTSSGC